jgi:hypothetical protein
MNFINSGIQGFRDLGIEGILSLLIFCFYPLIPQSPNSSIPQFLNPTVFLGNPIPQEE